uniref:Septum formation protein Maf n=1 Tax=Pyricularia oryzae (strain P131) TaxID=1143193 RepID=L7JLS4_PYRO1
MDEKGIMNEKDVIPEAPPPYIAAAAEHGIRLRQSAPPRPGPRKFELPVIAHIKERRAILASSSPRRKALLAQVGLTNLEIIPSTKPENLDKIALGPLEYVAATARQKCLDVYTSAIEAQNKAITAKEDNPPEDVDLVISADTVIVTRDGRILEKPRSENDHIAMLKHLRDTEVHRVLTSVCVLAPREDAAHPGYEMEVHTEETKVYFAQESEGLLDDVIESYVRTREGADKAGGYAVQGLGGLVLVSRIEGSFDNVIGLPVRKCLQLAEKVLFKQHGQYDIEPSSEEED